jgi:DNA-binding GntR family transcriptional regulator
MEKEELVDLRAVLEGYALRVICGRLTEVQLQRLDTTVRKTEDALRSQRLGEICRWNTRFHDTLHELISDRRRLYHQLVTMRRYAFRYGESAEPGLDGGRRTVEGHRRILTALRLRDPDLCERTMREHIRQPQPDPVRPLAAYRPQNGAPPVDHTYPVGPDAQWLSVTA